VALNSQQFLALRYVRSGRDSASSRTEQYRRTD
jgi:hypothetical protein